jgi:hypothetical protein
MSDYETRKANRINRYRELAAKNQRLFHQLHQQAHTMADVIPFGQPILIGHHSEGRDRRYRERIHRTFERAFEASDRADYFEERAAAIEENRAISSDDPTAADQIRAKIAELEKNQELFKKINKAVRLKDKEKQMAALKALGLSDTEIKETLTPDCMGRIGIPGFSLSNNNANIRRYKDRLEKIERLARMETREIESNGIRMVENVETNRIQLFFPGIPEERVRQWLSHHGFHWSRTNGCWQRMISPYARDLAKKVMNGIEDFKHLL